MPVSQQSSQQREDDYISLLKALAAILDRHGHASHSRIIQDFATRIIGGDSPSILMSTDIWGGSGSVTDCSILQGPSPSTGVVDDEQRFCESLVSLADLLIQDGFANSMVRSRRQTFSLWAHHKQQ